jgi:hypothetical protein
VETPAPYTALREPVTSQTWDGVSET